MKVNCIHCEKEITKQVDNQIEQFQCGQIECEHCKKKQKRYISESDLLIYFAISSIFYAVACVIAFVLFELILSMAFVFIAVIVMAMYSVLKYANRAIYKNAYFKKDIQDKVIEEDAKTVQGQMKTQLIIFLIIAIWFGTQIEYTALFFILVILFLVFIAFKINSTIKKERAQ